MSNYIDITPCSTQDTIVDIEITVSCNEYVTVHELLTKVLENMKENNTAIEPGRYRVRVVSNIIKTFT